MSPRYHGGPVVRTIDPWDGVLLVDKNAGPTSHDVVDFVRAHFRIPKVGHGGTLDPSATGLLALLLGRATKLSQQVMSTDKTYEGVMDLGIATDTHDADGTPVRRGDPSAVTREALLAHFAKWTGDVEQMPPMVSAIKKDGVPLYKMARKGEDVEREARLIHIFEFTLLDFRPPLAHFRVHCSKGTYVRTLCHDIGEGLGCGAHLKTLRRTRSGAFDVKDAVRFEDLVDLSRDALIARVIPLADFRAGMYG